MKYLKSRLSLVSKIAPNYTSLSTSSKWAVLSTNVFASARKIDEKECFAHKFSKEKNSLEKEYLRELSDVC